MWDKTKTIISTTDKYGTITDVNQTFIDVCGYSADELLGKPHNIIRHPDMPKIIFKITWDNILAGRNFHAIIKNLAKSGEYYWVITDFEVGRNIMGEVVTIMARRRAVPQYVITDHIEPLYQTLLKLEKIGGMELSNRYFKGFLEKQGKSYIEYIMDILDENRRTEGVSHQDIVFEPVSNTHHTEGNFGDYEISDEIFSEEHPEEESMMQRKSFFARLFSTNYASFFSTSFLLSFNLIESSIEIAERSNFILPARVSITQVSSVSSTMRPCIPPLVITLSPFFIDCMKFFSCFCRFICGRIIKK